ncbi:HEAT repeat domain-containing protein [Collimonas sp.]|jgi:HEAT repeat protein|uniref:HEAT repeat domain-containing protein n=1 Tax=Collimonas sp. TaxID=1963772 RepID=UPI002B7BF00C|nr:HEAT repeat domain-containing protein [Collimonas sp.]HWX02898.1 HEAT repeat domain-containing protein [Collimonas sp.]
MNIGNPMMHSLKSLVGIALQDWNSDKSWQAIAELQMRGSSESLAIARRFAKCRNWRKRALGLYIASQLRRSQKKWGTMGSAEYALRETQAILLAGLRDDCVEVVRAAISGFAHRPHQSALPNLVRFASHPDQQIRLQVAITLGSYIEVESIDALLRLATDISDDVRNWATFSIGSMHRADNPNIRDLLWRNLQDRDEDVRGEAVVGLAIRKDERVVSVLLELLDTDCRVFELDAAERMASPLLLDRLNALKKSVNDKDTIDSYWYRHLLDAIVSCSRTKM